MHQQTAKVILLIGAIIILIGIVWYFLGHRLNFLGRLPGDIRIEREGFRFYAPITTMLLLSLLLSLIVTVVKKFL